MKLSSLLAAAVLLVAGTALAYDLTYLGPIKTKETKTVKVRLPDGKSKIEVWSPSGNGKVTCRFATATYGGVVVEQSNVDRCIILPIVSGETDITVSVTNLENKDSDYRIWVHDPD
jgi:hypothetical protein